MTTYTVMLETTKGTVERFGWGYDKETAETQAGYLRQHSGVKRVWVEG